MSGPAENTVATFGSNGVLGIGNFLHDCGAGCVTNAFPAGYYACPSSGTAAGCAPAKVGLDRQVPNPIAVMGGDNNGATIQLAAVPATGRGHSTGTLFFGVGTQGNNSLGSARLFTLDAFGTFVTNFEGASDIAFIDSGSNAYFFPSRFAADLRRRTRLLLPQVGRQSDLGSPDRNHRRAQRRERERGIHGRQCRPGIRDQRFAPAGPCRLHCVLGGGLGGTFDWGLPFFYGRTVYVLFEGQPLGSTAGPAVGF